LRAVPHPELASPSAPGAALAAVLLGAVPGKEALTIVLPQ